MPPFDSKEIREINNILREIYPDVKLKKYLGEGNFAKVYLVDLNGEKLVIRIQKISKDYQDNADRMKSRYKAILDLDISHKNVMRLYSSAFVETQREFIMFVLSEYIDGIELSEIETILENKDEQEKANIKINIAKGLIDGLHHLHEKGIYHRDLKQTNVMIKYSGEPVIIDFGSICSMSDLLGTKCTNIVGNASTLSPISKTPVNKNYYYNQGMGSVSSDCNKQAYEWKNKNDMKNLIPYVKRIVSETDNWGLIFILAFLEHSDSEMSANDIFNSMKENGLVAPFPQVVDNNYCEFDNDEIYEEISQNWKDYMNNKSNLFYDLYQLFLKNGKLKQMVHSIENICELWRKTPNINPRTKRKIVIGAKTYKLLEKECGKSEKEKPKNKCSRKKCKSKIKSGKRKGESCGAKARFFVDEKCVCGRHAK